MPADRRRSLLEKIWDDHVVATRDDGASLLWVDRHLLHEVTSPQAFEQLRQRGQTVRRPDLTIGVADHAVATTVEGRLFQEPKSAAQIAALRANCSEFEIEYFEIGSPNHGIVHVIGPEQGLTLPGSTIVCGDSHTATHGAFGAFAIGIGSSDLEHVLATQTLWLRRPRTMRIEARGQLPRGLTAKDLALAVARLLPAGGANGHVIEYCGSTIAGLSMEARMTLCNMAIEVGARAALIAPDKTTFGYLKGRPRAPTGAAWEEALAYWQQLRSDPGAEFDAELQIDVSDVEPLVSWGTSSGDVAPIGSSIPDPDIFSAPDRRDEVAKSLDYMGLKPGTPLVGIKIDAVFIGSCTNGRLEDLRAAADVVRGRKVSPRVRLALVVPGSELVKKQAEAEGLDRVFRDAGFEWREPGCSMCLAMNADRVLPGERCASTSNRNFVGRQGPGSRTHLVSPPMAAAAAVTGHLSDVRDLLCGADDAAVS